MTDFSYVKMLFPQLDIQEIEQFKFILYYKTCTTYGAIVQEKKRNYYKFICPTCRVCPLLKFIKKEDCYARTCYTHLKRIIFYRLVEIL